MKLSIITINLNNYKGLQKTIQSVFAQSFTDYEYLIIDGGSTDGSKEYIEEQANKLIYWVSEKDNGVYNAMNKGIVKAKGEYLLFLNSGDYFFNNDVLKHLIENGHDADIVYGNLMVIDQNSVTELKYPEKLSFKYLMAATLPHPASLIKKKLFKSIGIFFEDLRIVSDWAFFIIAIVKYNHSYKYVPIPITYFHLDGISTDKKNQKIIEEERAFILKKYFPLLLEDYSELENLKKEMEKTKRQFGYRFYKRLQKVISVKPSKK